MDGVSIPYIYFPPGRIVSFWLLTRDDAGPFIAGHTDILYDPPMMRARCRYKKYVTQERVCDSCRRFGYHYNVDVRMLSGVVG